MNDLSLDIGKFEHPDITAKGERRASVEFIGAKTLWFNTGTLCNITCVNCYIESSPDNDRLVYMNVSEVSDYLDQITERNWPVTEIAFTGGEPFVRKGFPEFLVSGPLPAHFKHFSGSWRQEVADHRHQIPMTACFHFGDRKTVFFIGIGDTFDLAG